MTEDIFYQDLSLNPTVKSNGDMSSEINRNAIKQSIYMMVNTQRGTRIFNSNYGCQLETYLFEPFDEMTAKRIGKEIEETIKNYEKRIQLININVIMDEVKTSYDITVNYRIVNTQAVDSVKVSAQKL